jgi:hypothetical protein
MAEPEVSDEFLIDLLRERGYEVSKPEADLAEKVASVERKIDEMREPRAEPASPEERRYRFAEELRDRLNATRSKWYDPGGSEAA